MYPLCVPRKYCQGGSLAVCTYTNSIIFISLYLWTHSIGCQRSSDILTSVIAGQHWVEVLISQNIQFQIMNEFTCVNEFTLTNPYYPSWTTPLEHTSIHASCALVNKTNDVLWLFWGYRLSSLVRLCFSSISAMVDLASLWTWANGNIDLQEV